MEKRLYVGNLPFSVTAEEIRAHFASFGRVTDVNLVSDRETGRPRGFGFVEVDGEAAASVVEALDGQPFGGRTLRVNEARPRKPRQPHVYD